MVMLADSILPRIMCYFVFPLYRQDDQVFSWTLDLECLRPDNNYEIKGGVYIGVICQNIVEWLASGALRR